LAVFSKALPKIRSLPWHFQEDVLSSLKIIEWDESYALGIPLIDQQHKKLIDMTNTLYSGYLAGDDIASSMPNTSCPSKARASSPQC
jgi:hypothetical protein